MNNLSTGRMDRWDTFCRCCRGCTWWMHRSITCLGSIGSLGMGFNGLGYVARLLLFFFFGDWSKEIWYFCLAMLKSWHKIRVSETFRDNRCATTFEWSNLELWLFAPLRVSDFGLLLRWSLLKLCMIMIAISTATERSKPKMLRSYTLHKVSKPF